MELTRRAMLGALGGLAVGGTVASVVGTSIAADPKMKRFDQANGDFGWKPHKLDPNVCAPVAYEGYWHKGYACGYGTFYGIVGMMGEQYGAPYSQFPFTMLEANKAGVSGWGTITICGALYGAAAAFALFWGRKDRDAMVSELFRWYETTKLPIYDPGDAAQGVKGPIPSNASDSVLCHISVSKWCYEHKMEESNHQCQNRKGQGLEGGVPQTAIRCLLRRMPRFGQASRYSEGQNGLYALPQRQRTPDEQVQRSSLKSVFPLSKGVERTRMRPAVLPHLIRGIVRCPHKKGHVRSGKRRRHALFPCASTQQTLVFMYPAQ